MIASASEASFGSIFDRTESSPDMLFLGDNEPLSLVEAPVASPPVSPVFGPISGAEAQAHARSRSASAAFIDGGVDAMTLAPSSLLAMSDPFAAASLSAESSQAGAGSSSPGNVSVCACCLFTFLFYLS